MCSVREIDGFVGLDSLVLDHNYFVAIIITVVVVVLDRTLAFHLLLEAGFVCLTCLPDVRLLLESIDCEFQAYLVHSHNFHELLSGELFHWAILKW